MEEFKEVRTRSVIICSNESRTKEILPCVDSGIHCSILTEETAG